MRLQDREWYRTYHRWTRRRWRFQRLVSRSCAGLIAASVKLVVAAVLVAYVGVAFVHLTNGFNLGTTLKAGFQDARLGLTCPKKFERQWRFIDRTRLEHLGLVSSMNQGKHVYKEICSGDQFPPVGWTIPSPAPISDLIGYPTATQNGSPTAEVSPFNPKNLGTPTAQTQKFGWLDDIGILENAVHRGVNEYRDSFGLPALISDVAVSDKARHHSTRMAPLYPVTSELFHSAKSTFIGTGFGCGENVLARPRSISETLMYGVVVHRQEDIHDMQVVELAEVLVGQWIDSPGHEANMRGRQYTHSGVGIYYDIEQETVFATHNLCFIR